MCDQSHPARSTAGAGARGDFDAPRTIAGRWPLWLLLVSATAFAGAPGGGTLCRAPETTYFSCRTRLHASVSLCGALPANLQIREGSAERVALRVPAQAGEGARQLLYAHYARYRTERTEVTFSRNGLQYAVFDYEEDGRRTAGLRIVTADGRERNLLCEGAIEGRLDALGGKLPCDADSALNGGCVGAAITK